LCNWPISLKQFKGIETLKLQIPTWQQVKDIEIRNKAPFKIKKIVYVQKFFQISKYLVTTRLNIKITLHPTFFDNLEVFKYQLKPSLKYDTNNSEKDGNNKFSKC